MQRLRERQEAAGWTFWLVLYSQAAVGCWVILGDCQGGDLLASLFGQTQRARSACQMHARLSWLVLHCSVETRPQLVVHSTVTNRVLAGRLHHVQAFHPQNHHRKNHPRRSNLRHPKTRSCQKNLSRHHLRVNCCLNIDSPNRSIAHPRP